MRNLTLAAAGFGLLAAAAAGSCAPFPMPLCNGVDIEDVTVDQLQRFMILGNLTSQDLVKCYLARIDQTNNYTRSMSEVNPDALSIAAAMDEERESKGIRGPMHGIPFVIKDNYYTEDKHNTSEGTLVLLGGKYSREATVITKMRAAGGVLLGHASMDEAADHRAFDKYAGGYSSRTGQVRNPYNFTQPTAGSSSGSVVAIRVNQAPIALGTETHGSLSHPSGQTGLYTIKSTPGLSSRHGVVTGSYYHDTPGGLARSMKDVAIILDIIHGPDKYDNLTFEAVGRYPEDGYAAQIRGKDDLRGMKLGMPWFPYWSTISHINAPGIREVYDKRIKELKAAGAEIYNITNPAQFAGIANPYGGGQPANTSSAFAHSYAFSTLLAAGYAEWLQDWTFPEDDERYNMSTLAEMVKWNVDHNETTGALGNNTWWWDPKTGQSFYDAGVKTNGSLDSAFWTAFGWGRFRARQAIDNALAYESENGTIIPLDGLLIPNGRTGSGSNACASLPSYAGYPIATVPIGLDGFSTPYGFCVYGRQYSEATLLRVGSAMGDLFQWNEKPQWHGWQTAKGPWETAWPGYSCTQSSLDRSTCERA